MITQSPWHLKTWLRIPRKFWFNELMIKPLKYFISNVQFFWMVSFVSGLKFLINVENKKFVHLVNRMMKDFTPNKSFSFTKEELLSMEKSLQLDSDSCNLLLNSLNCLLRQVNYLPNQFKICKRNTLFKHIYYYI